MKTGIKYIISLLLAFGFISSHDDAATFKKEAVNSFAPQFKRFGGADRYAVQSEFTADIPDHTLDNVLVSSGLIFPDALSSGVLNNRLNSATLLIQDNDSIIQAKINEAKRLLKPAGRVLIVGGTGTVSAHIENEFRKSFNVERIGGKDRISVSVNVANKINSNPSEIFLTYGLVFSDSLSIVPYATEMQIPIILQYGNGLNEQVKQYLQSHPTIKKVTIVSGTGVIPVTIENELKSLGVTTIERVAGKDRYDTSLMIAKKYFPESTEVALSNGLVFADALSGSRFAYKKNMPIILINKDNAIDDTQMFIRDLSPVNIHLFGGPATINDSIKKLFQPAMNVKDFGAAGNGTTDDTLALQNAVNMAANQGTGVFLPKGTYAVKTLNLPGNTKIFGAGATIKENADYYSLFVVNGNNVSISNLSLEGSNRVYAGISVLANVQNVSISKVNIENISQSEGNPYPTHIPSGIRIYEGTKKIIVDSVEIKNVESKYKWVNGGPPIARGILISPNNDVYSPSEVVIKNSVIDGVSPKDDGDGVCVQLFKTTVNVQILDNYFVNNKKRAIKIQSPGVIVKGNKIYNSFKNNNFYLYSEDPKWYDMWSAISVYADNVTVENNSIDGLGSYGAAIDVAGANNVTVKDNFVANGITSNYKQGNLIVVSKSFDGNIDYSNINITGNTVANGNNGIVVSSRVNNLNVSGNRSVNVIKGYYNWYQ